MTFITNLGTLLAACSALSLIACATAPSSPSPKATQLGPITWQDDFDASLQDWVIELEQPGQGTASAGALHIDVPAGATLWLKHVLRAPVAIIFEATPIAAGGPNDRVSDK